MAEPKPAWPDVFSPHAGWPTTHWTTLIERIGDQSPAVAAAAREEFCRLYQNPVYSFLLHLRLGFSKADIEDVTQEFFLRLLLKPRFKSAKRTHRFRTFLMRGARWFLYNELRKRKREMAAVSLDDERAAGSDGVLVTDNRTCQQIFDRLWLVNMIELTNRELQAEYERKGEAGLFAVLVDRLEEEETALPYAEMARVTGKEEGALRAAFHRLRKRWGQSLLAKVAADLSRPRQVSPEEVQAELGRLMASLEA